jgi:hypothetical protein
MDVEPIFDEAAHHLVDENVGVERGHIMHAVGLKIGGKFFAFVRKDHLVVKLPSDRVTALIASRDGQPFDAGKGRPMKEWVCVRPADADTCVAFMIEARDFVARAQGIPG